MSRLNEYNVEFGVVFETKEEEEARKWLENLGNTSGGGATTGTKPATTGPTYAQSSLQDKQTTLAGQPGIYSREQLAAMPGARQIDTNTIMLGDGSKFSIRSDGTGLYGAAFTSAADRAKYSSGTPLGGGTAQTVSGVTPPPASSLPPEARPFAGQAGNFTNLTAAQGPVIPGFDAYRQPGIGIPSEGRQTIRGVENGLNVMTAGRQGSATQFPVAPGYRNPGMDFGNSIQFGSGSYSQRTLEPQMQFADTSVSVPGTYVVGQGNVNDSNRAYSVPFNIGGGGAALMNIAGNNVQLQSADKGTGYGFALNAMPASNVFNLTGRNQSEDPATQAAQTLMLNSAIAQGRMGDLMATNPNQFSGYRAGTGNGPFSGNGGMGTGTFWSGYSPDPAGAVLGTQAGAQTVPANAGTGLGSIVGSAPAPAAPRLSVGPVSIGVPQAAPPPASISPPTFAGSAGLAAPAAAPPAVAAPGYAPTNAEIAIAAMAAAAAAQNAKDEEEGGDRIPGYARGGSVATRPLGGKPDQVTNGPILGVRLDALHQGRIVPEFVVGEDNADADSLPNPEILSIKPIPGYATGGTVTTGTTAPATTGTTQYYKDPTGTTDQIFNTADNPGIDTYPGLTQVNPDGTPYVAPTADPAPDPVVNPTANPTPTPTPTPAPTPVTLPALPTLPVGTVMPTIDSGPEVQSMLNTAKIQQQQQSQQVLRARAGLGGTTAIRTNAKLTGLAPGYYTLPADYSEQIGAAQTELAGLGPLLNDPTAALTYQAQIDQLLAPMEEAQKIQFELDGLGPVGDPAVLLQDINTTKTNAGSLSTIHDLNQKLIQLGPLNDITALGDQINGIIAQIQLYQGQDPDPFGTPAQQAAYQQLQHYKSSLEPLQNLYNQEQNRNNQIIQTQQGLNNLLQASGYTDISQIAQPLADFQLKIETLGQAYDKAIKAGELRTALANYVPPGTDINERIGQLRMAKDQAKGMYENVGKANQLQQRIQSYRTSTEIQGTEQGEAPPQVIQQAVVTTPALKAVAQSDPQSANALARLDYALSGSGQWTPATSQLLVNLTNSLSGSAAKDSVQAMLQGLVAKMPQNRSVPPAIAAAAQSGSAAQIGAAAKFGGVAA